MLAVHTKLQGKLNGAEYRVNQQKYNPLNSV